MLLPFSRILITGATGFVGKSIAEFLLQHDYTIRGATRACLPEKQKIAGVDYRIVGDINEHTDWQVALSNIYPPNLKELGRRQHDESPDHIQSYVRTTNRVENNPRTSKTMGIDVVIHMAAKVHVMIDDSTNLLSEYRRINTLGTLQLLRQATTAGVKRFVYISSIKVNGEKTFLKPFAEHDKPDPTDPYSISKWEAEQGIIEWCSKHNIQYTILRLPLVYGKGVKANFAKLIKLTKSGLPLPMGAIKNQRSLLYLGNLTSALLTILQMPASANKTYLLSDGDDVSTPQLIQLIANAYQVKARLFSVPIFIFKLLGKLSGKSAAVDRLLGSLQVDASKIRQELNWQPPYTVASGLGDMATAQPPG